MAVVVGAWVVAVFALLVVALRPPLIVNVPGPSTGNPEAAQLVATSLYPACRWNGTASDFYLIRVGYANSGNRTANEAVANLTYTSGLGNATTTSLYLDVALGDVAPHAAGYIELYSVWVVSGMDLCSPPFDFRVTFTWRT